MGDFPDVSQARRTLAELLKPMRMAALVEVTGRSRQVIHDWRTGLRLPDVASLPALAALLNIDLADLTRLVAEEGLRREEARRAS